MGKLSSLSDIISFDNNFKSSINLYLNLNNPDKVLRYIPAKSSVAFLGQYLAAVKENKEQASLIVGPYGKGKSHLLLVLLAIVSMERNEENERVVNKLLNKINDIDEIGKNISEIIEHIWYKKGRFLPVLITNTQEDLNQAFLYALNDALKRESITDLIPDTFYSLANAKIQSWEENYYETYSVFESKVNERGLSIVELKAGLSSFSRKDLNIFTDIYPEITSGGEFNPMVVSDPLSLYKNVSEKLVDEYGYSGIYIVFDEFSKYIESQSGNANGSNMKLLQDMCELANDSSNSQIFITMVAHKSIKEYGKYLSTDIINAFTGIEGRIVEKLFVTSSKNNYELIKNAIIKHETMFEYIPNYERYLGEKRIEDFYHIPAFKSRFDRRDFESIVFRGCYPLNPVSAYLLLNVSEKVAQNERTLFTFISNDEPNSMTRYIRNHTEEKLWEIGTDLIYDYFAGLFKKEVSNEHVHNEWLNAEYALSKCTSEEERKVVKALAVLLIVNKEEEMPAEEKLLALATGVSNISEIVDRLILSQVLYKKGSTNSLVFKTRAGSALKTKIKQLRELKGDKANISKVFEQVTKKYYVIPRKYNVKYSMTRYFRHEFMSVENFLEISNVHVLFEADNKSDGKVISLYCKTEVDITAIREHIKMLNSNRLIVVCPNNKFDRTKQVLDFEILQEIKNNNLFTTDNEVLKKEIPILEEDLTKEIEEALYQLYEEDLGCKVIFMNDTSLDEKKYIELENVVNLCCEKVYCKTPIINNELINRHDITTGQTKKARINIIEAILNHKDDETFYSGTNQEATIYRSLLYRTGIKEGHATEVVQEVLDVMTAYLESCSDKKCSMKELIDKLTTEPYGMRKGVIPVYLGYLLSNRNEDIIVYFSGMEIQMTAEIVVNMCECPDDYELFMSKSDLQKEKYIKALNVLFQVSDNRNLTVNRIKNVLTCMQRWFRALPQITRNATVFSDYDTADDVNIVMTKLRKILQTIDPNPYEILFVRLPEMFGTVDNLEETYEVLAKCKTAFDDYFDWILVRVVAGTKDVFGVRKNQDLFHVVREWYEGQSNLSKTGLHGGRITNIMSCIEKLNVYDDVEVTKKLIKATTDVYIENWNDSSYDNYIESLRSVKSEIESIKEQSTVNKLKLSFVGRGGKPIERLYEPVTESTGTVLRNIIEDTLEEYDDLSINDRVAILLEMIEKVIG